MTIASASLTRPVLADALVRRGALANTLLVVGGAGFTALFAQLQIPLWPVPITGQTLAVLLVGSTLGAVRGAISMVLYALLGLVGLPVFSDGTHGAGVLFGATGGYIVGFIISAALVGWLAERQWDRKILKAIVTFVAGSVVVFAVGLPWLAVVLHTDLPTTLQYGLYPFIIGGIIKAAIAAGLLPLAWWGADKISAKRAEGDAS